MIQQERLSFFRHAIGDGHVGAVTMSSTYVVRAVLRGLPWNATTLVEHGPGSGALTRMLLHRLPPGGRLYAIERSAAFVDQLSHLGDPRLRLIEQSAEDLDYAALGIRGSVDAVVSSIPVSVVSPGDRRGIVASAHDALRAGGVLTIFHQYTPLMRTLLRQRFSRVRLTFEPRNLFPCFILQATK